MQQKFSSAIGFPTGLGRLSQDLASYADVLIASNANCPRSWERKIIACYVLDGHSGLGTWDPHILSG